MKKVVALAIAGIVFSTSSLALAAEPESESGVKLSGDVTVKSENLKCKLCMVHTRIEKMLPLATAPGAKVVLTVTPRK